MILCALKVNYNALYELFLYLSISSLDAPLHLYGPGAKMLSMYVFLAGSIVLHVSIMLHWAAVHGCYFSAGGVPDHFRASMPLAQCSVICECVWRHNIAWLRRKWHHFGTSRLPGHQRSHTRHASMAAIALFGWSGKWEEARHLPHISDLFSQLCPP